MTNPERNDSNLRGWLVVTVGVCSAAASAQAPAPASAPPSVARYSAADEAVYLARFGKRPVKLRCR